MITTHFKNKLIKQFDGHFIHYCFIKLLMNLKSSWKSIFFFISAKLQSKCFLFAIICIHDLFYMNLSAE